MNPANVHLFRVNNRNIWKRCETCLKLPIKTPERRHCLRVWCLCVWCLRVFIVNIEHISHLFQMFLLSILKKQMSAGKQYKMDRMMYTFVKITVKLGDQGQIWIIDKETASLSRFSLLLCYNFDLWVTSNLVMRLDAKARQSLVDPPTQSHWIPA